MSEFIDLYPWIKSFDHIYQAEIAQRITSTSEDFVAEISIPEVTYSNSKTIESHLEQLLKYLSEISSERDQSKRALNEALQERDQIAQNTGIDFSLPELFDSSELPFTEFDDFPISLIFRIRRFFEFPEYPNSSILEIAEVVDLPNSSIPILSIPQFRRFP